MVIYNGMGHREDSEKAMTSYLDDIVGVDTIQLYPRVFATRSALYGERDKVATRALAAKVDQALQHLRRFMQLPRNLTVLLRQFRGNTKGQYTNSTQVIELDVRFFKWREFYTALCHECVHAEQHAQGRFDLEYNRAERKWMFRWGRDYFPVDPAMNVKEDYEAYFNQPWELEAYRRENELAGRLMGIIKKRDGLIPTTVKENDDEQYAARNRKTQRRVGATSRAAR